MAQMSCLVRGEIGVACSQRSDDDDILQATLIVFLLSMVCIVLWIVRSAGVPSLIGVL